MADTIDQEPCESTPDQSGRKVTNQHSNRIRFKIGQSFSREQILDLLKFAMIESLPTKGFILENFPYDSCDALNFESLFYPALLGIYLTESIVLKHENPTTCATSLRTNNTVSRGIYAGYPQIELVTPKFSKRIKEFSFREAELVCEQYGAKLIRIINAEAVKPETFSFVSTVVENCLGRYPDGFWDFGNMPNALIDYFDSAPPTKLATDVSVVVRVDSVNLSPPGTVVSRKSTPIVHSRTESSDISISGITSSEAEIDDKDSSRVKMSPEARVPSPIWVQYSGSNTETEKEFHDGAGDRKLPARSQTKKASFGTNTSHKSLLQENKMGNRGECFKLSPEKGTRTTKTGRFLPSRCEEAPTVPTVVTDQYGTEISSGNDSDEEWVSIKSNDPLNREETLEHVFDYDSSRPSSINLYNNEALKEPAAVTVDKDTDKLNDDAQNWEETNLHCGSGSGNSSSVSLTTPGRTLSHLMTVARIFGQSSSNEDPDSSARRSKSRGRSTTRRKRYSKPGICKLLTAGHQSKVRQEDLETPRSQTKSYGELLVADCGRGDEGGVLGQRLQKRIRSRKSSSSKQSLSSIKNHYTKTQCVRPSLPNLSSSKVCDGEKNVNKTVTSTKSVGQINRKKVLRKKNLERTRTSISWRSADLSEIGSPKYYIKTVILDN